MKKILILGAAAAVVASVTMSATAATPVPFPAPTFSPGVRRGADRDDRRRDEQLVQAGRHGRVPGLRGRPEVEEGRRPEGRQVLLRDHPEPAERQAGVRREGSWSIDRTAVDGNVDGARHLPGGTRELQGPDPDQAERQASSSRASSCRCRSRPSTAEHLADGADGVHAGRYPPDLQARARARRSPRRSTSTPSPAPAPSELRSGRSAARRRTCSSAASRSSSAPGAPTSPPPTCCRTPTSTRRHVSIAGVPDVTLNWGAHGTVVLLVGPVDHPGHLSDRRDDAARRLQPLERQDRDLRLHDQRHPVVTERRRSRNHENASEAGCGGCGTGRSAAPAGLRRRHSDPARDPGALGRRRPSRPDRAGVDAVRRP